jgi:hypothetical protein
MDRLNRWLTLLANLGVIVGILLLVYETRQNTEAINSQTRAAIYAGAQEELWKNMEYPDVTVNFQTTDHKLTVNEKVRLDAWLTASLRAREFAWLEYRSGNVDEGSWQAERQVIRFILGTRRLRAWWRDIARDAFHPEFAREVDALIEGPEVDYAARVLAIH